MGNILTSLQKQARNQKNRLCKLIAQQKGGSSREGEFSLTTWGIHGLARKPLRVTLQKQLQFLPDTIRTLTKVQLRLRGKGDQTPTHLHEKCYIHNIFITNIFLKEEFQLMVMALKPGLFNKPKKGEVQSF